MRFWLTLTVVGPLFLARPAGLAAENPVIGNHRAVYDAKGMLLPWTSWRDALAREMNWYLLCPVESGYPRFVYVTFMRGDYQPVVPRSDIIPSMQNGMGIVSYLKSIHNFTSIRYGVPVCGEQTDDTEPWGGVLSTYGAVLAMYSAATGDGEYKALANQALNFALYAVNDDGCPRENAVRPGRGGWQEDAHTDKIHNFVDDITAFPEGEN